MRRVGLAGVVLMGVIATTAFTPAAPSEGPRPRVVDLTWGSRPLTAGARETLEIRAVDVDGVISTVNVSWGDGVLDHADLICFGVGEVTTVKLSHAYRGPGLYHARVRVSSGPKCFTADQTSPAATIRAPVRP